MEFFKEHKKACLMGFAVLLLFTCGSAMSAVNVAHHRAATADTPASSSDTIQTEAEGTGTDAEPAENALTLTDAQKEAIENYDESTKSFISTLTASLWQTSEGRYSLRFADDSYVETVNGTPERHTYAITRMETARDGYGGTLNTLVFLTDTGTHIVTYTNGKGSAANTNTQAAEGTTISPLNSATMFAQKNTAYERADAVEAITIKGLNSEVTTLFGGDEKALAGALSNWCAVHYPSVTCATWKKVVSVDYENNVLTTSFSLNDTNPVTITCVYETDTGTFSFTN